MATQNILDHEVSEGNDLTLLLPTEMCEEIFLYVPAIDLVTSASRVCKNWYHLLRNRNFWLRKVKREGFQFSAVTEKRLTEEKDLSKALHILQGLSCHLLGLNTNLIQNPSGQDGLKKWHVQHGGNGLDVENPPIGSNLIPEEAGLPTSHCFVSSFTPCIRTQLIKLKDHNLQPWMMDILQPKIEVSEWVSARFDCAARSTMKVKIFGSGIPVNYKQNWSSSNDGVERMEWYKMSFVADYEEGLHSIKFTNTSTDEQFWAGHYGAKTAGSSVVLKI
ncbi:F-box only protein 27-like [Portunus trituberculatus]|uniref:F-box only protein 27-like n=1 Tax=Portunus trituberculatus TaxID=210409 RepID=UPI001E1CE022|nr:F-box only protein 27-like [Portunus trituberculatus]